MFGKRFLLFLSGILLCASCTKTTTVHFHGRVTLLCDGSPLSHIPVSFVRNYANSVLDDYGPVYTDANGYYSLITQVKLTGNGIYYVNVDDTNYVTGSFYQPAYSNDSKDILTNYALTKIGSARCHIKNVSPVNGNDVFDSLEFRSMNYNFYTTAARNLYGTAEDTTIFFKVDWPEINFRYTFTKAGTATVRTDSISRGCSDITDVDIFY